MRTPFDLIQALRSWFFAKDAAINTGGLDIDTSGGDVIVGAGNVDGVDLTAHVADTDAHHNKSHALDSGSDHTGTLPWSDLDLSASDLADLAARSHGDLTDFDASDHDGRYFREDEFTSSPGANSKPLESNASGQMTLVDLFTSSSVRAGSGITVGSTTETPGDALIMLEERATPGTPSSGYVYIWAATTGRVYSKDDTGTVRELSN